MNLEDFIKESLAQIFRSVHAMSAVAKETGAEIAPRQYAASGIVVNDVGRPVEMIDFDVAVTATDTGEVKGGIAVMGLGVKGGQSELNSTVSRIKFRIPVTLPSFAPSDAQRIDD
jgi:hypothetical protein